MLFGLYTKSDMITVASAVAEANNTTLASTLRAINANASALENEAKTALNTASANEASAQKTYEDTIAAAQKTLDQAGAEVDKLRADANGKLAKAAGKKKAIKLLS